MRGWARDLSFMLGMAIVALWLAGRSAPAEAAGSVVGDGTPASCSEADLRAAVNAGGTITFDCGGPKAIILNEQKPLSVHAQTVIDGGGQITVSGSNQTRIFHIYPDIPLTVRNMTLTNGFADGSGGAVYVSSGASFTAENSTIQNSKTNNGPGSAIYVLGDGAIALTNSVVHNNSTKSYGAINSTGSVTVTNSILSENHSDAGGGAMSLGGTVSIINSQFLRNNGGYGGALFLTETAAVDIEGSTFKRNLAKKDAGAVYNKGDLEIYKSNISANAANGGSGGAIASLGKAAFLGITASTIEYHLASKDAGALWLDNSIAYLTNVTISGNVGSDQGGGLDIREAKLFLYYVTLYNNNSNIDKFSSNIKADSSEITIHNSIIARRDFTDYPNCSMTAVTINSQGYNLTDDKTCGLDYDGLDSKVYNVELADLAYNGGNMRTHMPKYFSPAIDAGACFASGVAVDQRGAPRPTGNACDIGAVEYGLPLWKVSLPMLSG